MSAEVLLLLLLLQIVTNITKRVVNVDLSAIGPQHTAEINLPSFPNLKAELLKVRCVTCYNSTTTLQSSAHARTICTPHAFMLQDVCSCVATVLNEMLLCLLVTQGPNVDVKLPQLPKVIDLSGLGPSKTVNLTLPEVKFPHPGSLTIRKGDNNTQPQFLDLTGKSRLCYKAQHNMLLCVDARHVADRTCC